MNRYVVDSIAVVVFHFYIVYFFAESGRNVLFNRLPASVFVGKCLILFSGVEFEPDIVGIHLVYDSSFYLGFLRSFGEMVSGRDTEAFLYERLSSDNQIVAYGSYVVHVVFFLASVRVDIPHDEFLFAFDGILENEFRNLLSRCSISEFHRF